MTRSEDTPKEVNEVNSKPTAGAAVSREDVIVWGRAIAEELIGYGVAYASSPHDIELAQAANSLLAESGAEGSLSTPETGKHETCQPVEGEIHILFDGPPSHESGRFIETENAKGEGISVGRWEQRGDYWHLIIPRSQPAAPVPERITEILECLADLFHTPKEIADVAAHAHALIEALAPDCEAARSDLSRLRGGAKQARQQNRELLEQLATVLPKDVKQKLDAEDEAFDREMDSEITDLKQRTIHEQLKGGAK